MDISLLKTFLEVARTRHFSRAADALFLTQSAVSARIKQLEEILGAELFVRKRNDIQLTPAGNRLLQHAETLLKGWERARQSVALDPDLSASLSAGCLFDLWTIYVERWARRFRKCAPDIALQIGQGQRAQALLEQAGEVDRMQPDLIEWRVDALEGLSDLAYVHRTLTVLRAERPALPLLFTCRAREEGGLQAIVPDHRRKLYHMAIGTGLADLIDIELASGPRTIQALRAETAAAGVHLILSFHDFERTPGREVLVGKLREAEQAGADIAKIAVMPRNCRDVATLLDAACEARLRYLKIPLIAIAMGEAGVVTRIAGGQFGSDIIFASGGIATAPGQIAIQDLELNPMVTALALAGFAGMSQYVILWQSHRKGEYGIALANSFGPWA